MAGWNASHSGRWNHFRTVMRREYPQLEFFRGVEVQSRGALHDHAMVWSPVPLELAVVKRFAMGAGFGHSVDLAPVAPGSKREAYYVSKYVTKSADSRQDVPWLGEVVDIETGEVTEALVAGRYRTWSMSRAWGLTMSAVRAQSAVYARARAEELLAIDQAAAVDVLLGAFPGSVLVDAESPPLPS